ncbi:MAG: methyltransferase [Anaerolineaceae bacterium]|nr:methyltransferase [Anaerolineaceae bacterium]
MDTQTVNRLNAINRAFYATVADDFDQTRGTAWPGWQRLLPYLKTPISVLDVGCGNARFALFLHDNLSAISQPPSNSEPFPVDSVLGTQHSVLSLSYTGLDSSPALLAHARTALADRTNLTFTLEQRDIIENPPDSGEYDLVVLLGVLHHIPGYEQRQTFMRQLAKRVKSGGLLVFAAWRFYEYERFRERVVSWPDDLHVEHNDYLLDWRRGAVSLRYCHYTDDAEHDALVEATGLTQIDTFRADGQGGTANRYSFLRF